MHNFVIVKKRKKIFRYKFRTFFNSLLLVITRNRLLVIAVGDKIVYGRKVIVVLNIIITR